MNSLEYCKNDVQLGEYVSVDGFDGFEVHGFTLP